MLSKQKYLLIDHYDSFTYNLLALIQLQGIEVTLIENHQYRSARGYDALVFSAGPSHPRRAGVSLRYFDDWAGRLPIFGVCLGMQVMAYKLGATDAAYGVQSAASIQHGKTDQLKISGSSGIYRDIPDGITVVRYHSLAVRAPAEYISSQARSDGEAMSLEVPQQKLYGVQFHPESLLSECGAQLIRNFAAVV